MKKYTIASLAAVGALALTACSGGANSAGNVAGEPVIDGTLNYAINDDPGSLFRLLNSSGTLPYITSWVYETLVFYNQDGKPQGRLATSWEETPTSLHFEIRDDAICSDGTPLTAETVANNFRWITDPANGSALAGLTVPTDTVVENDDTSVTLTTSTPNSFLMGSIGANPIYCQAALDDPESVKLGTNGTGMYKLVESVPGDHYTLERRDEYNWAPEGAPNGDTPGVPKNVVISVITNPSTRANMLLSGDLNIASVSASDAARVASTMSPAYAINLVTGGFVYSQAEGMPTADENVRIALTKALDLDALMAVNTEGKGKRAPRLAVVSPDICQYDAATPNLPSHDVAAAEKMLDEAGWVKGPDGMRAKDGEPLELNFAWQTRWPENAATAEMIGEQWKAVGVKVNQEGSDYSAFAEKTSVPGAASKYDVMWIAPNYAVPDVLSNFFSGPAAPAGKNLGEVKNPEFTRLAEEASSFSGSDACPSWQAAENEMYRAADYVPFAMREDVVYGNGIARMFDDATLDQYFPSVILVK